MKGSSLSSLLVLLSLGALVVAGLASAIDYGAGTVIRLPSDGEGVTDDGEEEMEVGARPWKCCNKPQCTRSIPPTCHCMDTVSKCYSACKSCKELKPGSHRYRCLDAYKGQPGPKCTKAEEMNQGVISGVNHDDQEEEVEAKEVAVLAAAQAQEDEIVTGKRPWKCCNTPRCTKSFPPTCHCMDTVSKCYSACKSCKEVKPGSHRYHCLDAYKGQPGPKCTKADKTNQGLIGGVNDDQEEEVEAKEVVVIAAAEAEEDEIAAGKRPWKCCNTPRCTKSFPPTCHCMDTVSKCYSACKSCKEVKPGSHRYHCLDAYKGQPGPKCTKADETNQGLIGGVNDDQEEEVEAKEVAVIAAAEAEEDEIAAGKRPWKCCNKPQCTRSIPPTCHCMDTISKCYSACKSCKEVKPGSHRYHCLDAYKGQPGPKCPKADEANQGVVTCGFNNNDDQEASAEAEMIPAVEAEEEENAGGKRPWKCCNKPQCTKSSPPVCHCMDTVSKCYSACKSCKEMKKGSHHYRCLDAYKGQPGPKCTKADDETNAVVGGGDE